MTLSYTSSKKSKYNTKYNKRNFKNNKSLKTKKNKQQRGGLSPSCLKTPDNSRYMNTCNTANIHNTNPEGAYNLLEGEGVLPQTPVLSGGSSCTNIPTQAKPLTFTDYLNRTSIEISGGAKGNSSNFDTTSLENEKAIADGFGQSGGSGFSINPEEMIGGLPGRAKYDSCCQPAIIGGKLTQGKGTEAICGHQMGGKHKKTVNKKQRSLLKSKKTKNTKNANTKQKTGKRTMKRNVKRNMKGKQKGGVAKYPFEGETSNYDYLADGKDFDGKQPYWSVDTR